MALEHTTSVGIFDPEKESWLNYNERLENYFELKEVANGKKTATLINFIGPDPYAILKDYFSPRVPSTVAYKDLVKALTDHYVPATMKWTERYKLSCRNQRPDESCSQFAAALRKLAKFCMFGAYLDEALTLRFICGLNSESIRKRLLLTEKDTFKEVIEVACKCEQAEKHAEMMQQRQAEIAAPVHKVHQAPRRRGFQPSNNSFKKKCGRCGKSNHTDDNCRFINAVCHKCGRKGHIKPVCRGKPKNGQAVRLIDAEPAEDEVNAGHNLGVSLDNVIVSSSDNFSLTKGDTSISKSPLPTPQNLNLFCSYSAGAPVNFMSCCENVNLPEGNLSKAEHCSNSVNSINDFSNDSFYIWPYLNGKRTRMEIDTGSAVSIMSLSDVKRLFPGNVRLRGTNLLLRTYTNQKITPAGAVMINVNINNIVCVLKLYIVHNYGKPLFGRQWIRAFSSKLDLFSLCFQSSKDSTVMQDKGDINKKISAKASVQNSSPNLTKSSSAQKTSQKGQQENESNYVVQHLAHEKLIHAVNETDKKKLLTSCMSIVMCSKMN